MNILKIVENFKRRLRIRNLKPRNKTELFNLLKEEWFNTKPRRINKINMVCYEGLILTILKNKGNPTGY